MGEAFYKVTVGGIATIGTKDELIAMLKDDLENFNGAITIEKVGGDGK